MKATRTKINVHIHKYIDANTYLMRRCYCSLSSGSYSLIPLVFLFLSMVCSLILFQRLLSSSVSLKEYWVHQSSALCSLLRSLLIWVVFPLRQSPLVACSLCLSSLWYYETLLLRAHSIVRCSHSRTSSLLTSLHKNWTAISSLWPCLT